MNDLEPPASQYLDTLGYRTHYIEQGEGRPVILIHGGGPGADAWGNWFGCMTQFAAEFRTIAIDLAGYGGSEAPEGFVYSQDNRNRQLVAFIEALGAGPVSVVGNSMGGATAMGAAMLRPDLIESLVLMGSAGLHHGTGRAEGGRPASPLANYDFTVEGMKRIAEYLGGKNFKPTPGMVDYRFELVTRPERRVSFAGINKWLLEAKGLHYDEDDIAKIKTRALVFNGKDDPIVKMSHAFRLLELLENSSGHFIPHCGHWAMLEYPDVFASESIKFLQEAA